MSKSLQLHPTIMVDHAIYDAPLSAFMEVNVFTENPLDAEGKADLESMLPIRLELDRINGVIRELTGGFHDALNLLMAQRKLSAVVLSKRCDISDKTIRKYQKGILLPSLTHVLALCIGLNLHPELTFILLKKAGYNLEDTNLSLHRFFCYLIRYHHMETLDLWNQRLIAAGFDAQLPSHSAQKRISECPAKQKNGT